MTNFKFFGFVVIFLVAIYFRGYNLYDRVEWSGDSSRDISIARHIAFLGDRPLCGQYTWGGHGLINNSSLYYYFTAGVHSIWDNVLTIPYFFVIVDSLAVAIFFLIAFEFNKGLGLVFGLVLAVNRYLSTLVLMVTTPYLMPIVVMVAIYFWYKSSKSKNIIYFLGYIYFCILSLHIHYSILSIFPVLIIGGLWLYKKNLWYKKKWWIPILWTIILLMIWVGATYRVRLFDQFEILGLLGKNHNTIQQILTKSIEIHQGILDHILNIKNNYIVVIFWLCFYIGGGWITWKKRKTEPLLGFIFLLFASINLSSFIGGSWVIGNGYIHYSYQILFLFIFLVLNIFSKQGRLRYFFTIIIGIILLMLSINYKNVADFLTNFNRGNHQVEMNINVSKLIVEDVNRHGGDYDIIFYDENYGIGYGKWEMSPSLWYFVEKIGKKKMINADGKKGGDNVGFTLISDDNNPVFYLLCSYRNSFISWDRFKECEDAFQNMYSGISFKKHILKEDNIGNTRYRLNRMTRNK